MTVLVDADANGGLGVYVYVHTKVKFYIDDSMVNHRFKLKKSLQGIIISNIPTLSYPTIDNTQASPGSAPFTCKQGAVNEILVEY